MKTEKKKLKSHVAGVYKRPAQLQDLEAAQDTETACPYPKNRTKNLFIRHHQGGVQKHNYKSGLNKKIQKKVKSINIIN